MKIGLQIPDFTGPGAARLGADLATVARTADDAGFEFISVMDHFFQIGMVGPPEHDMLEAYTTLGYLAALHVPGQAGHPGDRRRLPASRHPGEDRDHARRAVRRPGLAGHRRGLERGGVPGPGHPVPAGRRAVRAAGGDTPDLPADVARRRVALPGPALSAGAAAELPEGAVGTAPADHDRRLRRAARRCGSSPATPRPATCSPARTWPASSTCCARTATRRAATTTRSRRPAISSSMSAPRASRPAQVVDQLGDLAELGIGAAIGAVAGVWDVTPLEIIGSEVIPAVAGL